MKSLNRALFASDEDWGKVRARSLSTVRVNVDSVYAQNKQRLLSKFNAELDEQNRYDVLLYRAVVERFCLELHQYGLWNYRLVREYWQLKAPFRTTMCP